MMRPRCEIPQLFSTFIQLVDDRFDRWVVDAKLQRSMARLMSQASAKTPSTSLSEAFWSQYWHRCWAQGTNSLALEHLAAYLQEPCYTAALRTITTVSKTSQQTIADGFQVAIAALTKVLKQYSAEHGASLKTYAQLVFSNTIRDTLRQRREAAFCTDWVLLRKLSHKRFQAMLQAAGFERTTIDTYRLAWMSFQAHYVPSLGKGYQQADTLPTDQWQAITDTYEQQRYQLTPPAPKATAADLEHWLKHCAKQARAFLYPAVSSLNVTRPGFESGELQDDLVGSEQESLLSDLIEQEDREAARSQQATINQVLTTALASLNPESQEILALYYRHGQTQQDIAAQLETKQYTVSRRLRTARQKLLTTLAQWSAETLHISLDSTALDRVSVVLEEWLQNTYGNSEVDSQGE